MTTITLELPETELKLFMALAEKLNAKVLAIEPPKVKQSPMFWLEQLRNANIKSSIKNPSEWQRVTREDRTLPFRF